MNQNARIYRHLQQYGSITTVEAFAEYGIARLAARIWELKAKGIPVVATEETGKNRYGEPVRYTRYKLEENHDLH